MNVFYAQNFGTRIKIISDVYGGSWDALISGRAEISISALGDAPPGGDYLTKQIGTLAFNYAVEANQPLAYLNEPLQNQDVLRYRTVTVGNSSHELAPRTSGILSEQDILVVPDMQAKLEAQIAGLGVGYLPKNIAEKHAATGELVIKLREFPNTS